MGGLLVSILVLTLALSEQLDRIAQIYSLFHALRSPSKAPS